MKPKTENGVLTPQQLKSIPNAPQELKQSFATDETYKTFIAKAANGDHPLIWLIDRNAISCGGLLMKLKDSDGHVHDGYFCTDLLNKFGVTPEQIVLGATVKLLGDHFVNYGIVCNAKNVSGPNVTGVFFPAATIQKHTENSTAKKKEINAVTEKQYRGYFLMLGDEQQLFSSPMMQKVKPSKNHVKW